MQKIFNLFVAFALILLISAIFTPAKSFAVDSGGCSAGSVLITEIQAGEVHYNNHEFVELYNCSPVAVGLDGYTLSLRSADGTEKASIPLNGIIASHGFLWILHGYYADYLSATQNLPEPYIRFSQDNGQFSAIDAAGGYALLVAPNGLQIDQVSYGSISDTSLLPAPKPPSNQSIKRCVNGGDIFSNTHDNSKDFLVTPLPTLSYLFLAGPSCIEGSDNSSDEGNIGNDNGSNNNQNSNDDSSSGSNNNSGGQGAGPQTSCDGVIISELLVNPAGSDTGHEFIELYNPTEDFIPLAGCKLQTSASSKVYEFSEGQMDPGEFQAFYNGETGLTLTNSGGGSVYLIDTDTSEIYQADYPGDLADDVSWSLMNGAWRQTYSVTPNEANELLGDKPCPAGQARNPESGRCINVIEEAAGLAPCPEGKERNPDTNRCRNIASLAAALTACAANQVRNPATNRCKKIDGSSSSLAPCKPGQERNPQTHRCRKSTASSSSALKDVKDVLSDTTNTGGNNWYASGLAISGAFLYAFWEWRNEILEKLGILKAKFGKISP